MVKGCKVQNGSVIPGDWIEIPAGTNIRGKVLTETLVRQVKRYGGHGSHGMEITVTEPICKDVIERDVCGVMARDCRKV